MTLHKITYWAGNSYLPLSPEDSTESGISFHYTGLFGDTAQFYFYSFKIDQPIRLQFYIPPSSICMLVSEEGAFMHIWNGQSRWLAKTLGDIFYSPENSLTLEFSKAGRYSFNLIQIDFDALQPLLSLNAPMQSLIGKAAVQQMVCLNQLPLVMDLEDRVLLEDLRLIKENPVPPGFVSGQCLLVFIRAIEKLIRQGLQFAGGSLLGYDQENLERAVSEITANPDQKMSIPELVKRNGLSLSRFKFLFKQQFGMTVHHFILKIRMDKATGLITHTRLSIREIASEVGYANDSTFSAFFKKKTGISPSKLRRRVGG